MMRCGTCATWPIAFANIVFDMWLEGAGTTKLRRRNDTLVENQYCVANSRGCLISDSWQLFE